MFFSQANLVDDHVVPLPEPWKVRVPQEILDIPKDDYKARWRNPAVKHWLLSLAEGRSESFAVTNSNQAAALHGFFADYDGVFTQDMIDIMARKKTKYPPAWWCLSQSRQLHLVWLFERPIAVTGNVHACDLLHVVAMKVKAPHWGVGYDPDSEKVTQVMDIGREWHPFREDARIPSADLVQWDVALFEKAAKQYSDDAMKIPFEDIVPKIRELYPDAPADFREGTRCRRFWDASADNPTACLVRPEGIVVFTPHDGGFKSWPSLLGRDFCEHYSAVSMAPFYEDTYYVADRDAYVRFMRNENPQRFIARNEKVLRRDIVAATGMSTKPPKDGGLSKIDEALHVINERNGVDGAVPVIYRPAGRLALPNGTTVLNTSLVTVLKPAGPFELPPADVVYGADVPNRFRAEPDACEWDNPFVVSKFPHIHQFLTTLFLPTESARRGWEAAGYRPFGPDAKLSYAAETYEQLTRFLSWLSHWYRNAARMSQTPHPGQALFIAGDASIGKSFLARVLVSGLMGGCAEAPDFYINGARFNSELLAAPLHIIDDRLGSIDFRHRMQFSECVKIVVANAGLRYERKFGDAIGFVPWAGRLMVMLNRDPQSMSVLPDLEVSTADKFMMLRCGTARFPFGLPEQNAAWVREELPFFARFLLGYSIPEEMRDVRFGVSAWQHPEMRQASTENGLTIEVVESLVDYFAFLRQSGEKNETVAFRGTVGQLYSALATHSDTFRANVKSSKALRQQLQILVRSPLYSLSEDDSFTPSVWSIPYDFVRRD